MAVSDGNNNTSVASPPAVAAAPVEHNESDKYSDDDGLRSDAYDAEMYNSGGSNSLGSLWSLLWMLFAIVIVISGLTIVNGYAINDINERLDRNDLRVHQNDLRVHRITMHIDSHVDQQLRRTNTEIARLGVEFDRIADQEGDVLLLFKRLSDQYNLMGQQLRGTNFTMTARP